MTNTQIQDDFRLMTQVTLILTVAQYGDTRGCPVDTVTQAVAKGLIVERSLKPGTWLLSLEGRKMLSRISKLVNAAVNKQLAK